LLYHIFDNGIAINYVTKDPMFVSYDELIDVDCLVTTTLKTKTAKVNFITKLIWYYEWVKTFFYKRYY